MSYRIAMLRLHHYAIAKIAPYPVKEALSIFQNTLPLSPAQGQVAIAFVRDSVEKFAHKYICIRLRNRESRIKDVVMARDTDVVAERIHDTEIL